MKHLPTPTLAALWVFTIASVTFHARAQEPTSKFAVKPAENGELRINIGGDIEEAFDLLESPDLENWETTVRGIPGDAQVFVTPERPSGFFALAPAYDFGGWCGAYAGRTLLARRIVGGREWCAQQGAPDFPEVRDLFIPDANSSNVDYTRIRLHFHLFENSPYDTATIDALVDRLNGNPRTFAGAGIDFVHQVSPHPASPAPSVPSSEPDPPRLRFFKNDIREMKETYHQSGALNIYLVKIPPALEVDGEAILPWALQDGRGIATASQGGIILNERDHVITDPDAVIPAHEIGHALGLYHVFKGLSESSHHACKEKKAQSLADGDQKGDFCADTAVVEKQRGLCPDPPSPGLEALYETQLNLMSYFSCADRFTPQQAGRMQAWIRNQLMSWVERDNQDLPTYPGEVRAIPVTTQLVEIVWTDRSNDETLFVIERAKNAGQTWEGEGTVPAAPGTGNRLTYAVPDLTRREVEWFRVRAVSPTSGTGDQYGYTLKVRPSQRNELPRPPLNLSVRERHAETKITLRWTDDADDETGYEVERADGNGTFLSLTDSLERNTTYYEDTSVELGAIYHYRVRALKIHADFQGVSEYSAATEAQWIPTEIEAPSGLAAIRDPANLTKPKISWIDRSTKETSFDIERATSSDGPFAVIANVPTLDESGVDGSPEPSFTDPGAEADTFYFYRVRSRRDGLVSEARDTVSIYIPGAAPTPPDQVAPSDSATDLSLRPTFAWEPATAATAYTLDIQRTDSPQGARLIELATQTSHLLSAQEALTGDRSYRWRVRAGTELPTPEGALRTFFGAWGPWREFTTDFGTPTLASPSSGSRVTSAQPNFQWSAVNGAIRYLFELKLANGTGVHTQFVIGQNSLQLPPDLLIPGADYTWQVTAVGLVKSHPSPPQNFNYRTEPQDAPTRISPARDIQNSLTRPLFEWTPVAQSTSYDIELIRVNDPSIVVNYTGLTGTTYQPPTSVAGDRQFDWRVRAVNEINAGPWSKPKWRFRTRLDPPVLTSPANGATNVSRRATFQWNKSLGAGNYQFQIAADSPNPNGVLTRRTVTTPDLTTRIPAGDLLKGDRTYFWRVQAIGPTKTKWSDWSSLKTEIGPPVDPPRSLSPSQNAAEVLRRTRFDWSDLAKATSYEVRIFRVNTGGNLIRTYTGIAASAFTIPDGDEIAGDRQFDWKVRGVNSFGNGPWSETLRYRTRISGPDLVGPANGSTNLSVTPTLSWAASSGAASYTFEIAADAPNASGVIERRTVTTTRLNTTIPGSDDLKQQRLYFWRVRANGPTTTRYSSWWSFTTQIRPPCCAPVPINPAQNSTNRLRRTQFNWNARPNATSYDLRVIRVSSGAVVREKFGLTATEYKLTEEEKLAGNREFDWRVRGVNSAGTGPWSDKWRFRTRP